MVYFCKGKRIQQSTTVPGPFSAHIQTFMSIREKGVMQKEENFLFFLLELQWICFYVLPPPKLITTTTETTTKTTTSAIQNNKFVLSHDNAKITKI